VVDEEHVRKQEKRARKKVICKSIYMCLETTTTTAAARWMKVKMRKEKEKKKNFYN